jgi:hypothetical protein
LFCEVSDNKPNHEIGEQMKSYLSSLAAVLLLMSISPVKATAIRGTFDGVITDAGGYFPLAVGTDVTGHFRYDPDDLQVDSYGNRWTSEKDPSVLFEVDNLGGWDHDGGLLFSVDANGFPSRGGAAGRYDLGIGPGGNLGFWDFDIAFGRAKVTYAMSTRVPECGATSSLMVIALASLVVVRRFISP